MSKDKFIAMVDTVVSIISKNRNILDGNEAQTRWLLIDPFILDCWGYKREDIIVEYCVDSEERVNAYDKLDYSIILNNKPKLLIEAKSLGLDLYSRHYQLSSYFSNIYSTSIYNQNELIGILTDGDLYLFFTDSKEQGVLDKEPYLTIRLSVSEDEEILKLMKYSKRALLDNPYFIVAEGAKDYGCNQVGETLDFDLDEYYRIDMVERVFNHYESKGSTLCIQNVSIRGRYKKIKSFRTLYREILKEINNLEPNLIYELALNEESKRVEGSISEYMFSLNPLSTDSFEIATQRGIVYISLSRTRKGMIDRIVELLKYSNIGIFNVTVRLKEKQV